MKVTIIGHWGGFPKVEEATSGYLIEHENYSLLLECGSGVVSSLQKVVDLGKLDGVLLTHYHYDHCCDIGPLQYARQIKTQLGEISKPLPIYAPTGSFFDLLKWENYTYGEAINENSVLNLGPFQLSFIKNVHPVETFSVKIKCEGKTLSFTSDTAYYDDLTSFIYKSDLLLCECSFYAHMDGSKAGHLNSTQAGILASKSQVKKLVLTHLPHFGNHDDLIKEAKEEYSGEILLAKHLLQLII